MQNELKQKRVLVVDDDRDFVKTLEVYLKYAGYEVSCAFGGLERSKSFASPIRQPSILDVMMPDIDGRRVVRYIREKMGDSTPVIIRRP